MTGIDPITFAVIKSGLDTIVDDMAYAVMRTARSPIVRDVLDYSVTICDAQGRILSQAKTVALHLGGLYEQLLRALLPLPARPHETLAEHVARLDALAAKQREADKTAAKLEKERQFNRKVAINADLRRLQTEVEALRR